MLGRDICLPINFLTGRPDGEQAYQSTDCVRDLQKHLEKVYNFTRWSEAQNWHDESSYTSYSYAARSKDEALDEGNPMWLYNPTMKKGLTPKLMRPW